MPVSTERCFVGTMPPGRFLDDFLATEHLSSPTPEADFSKVASNMESSQEMCMPFIRTVKKSKLLPGLRLFIARTKKRWSENFLRASPSGKDVGDSEVSLDLCPTISARKEPSRRGLQSTNISEYYSFATSLVGIEVRHSPDADPFADPEDYESSQGSSEGSLSRDATHSPPRDRAGTSPRPLPIPSQGPLKGSPPVNIHSDAHHESPLVACPPKRAQSSHPISQCSSKISLCGPVERETEEGTSFRRSLVAHAHAQFARQHRTFLFQLVIVNRWARFVRWDRSGAIVSSRFDYVLEPGHLCEFLWRFAHLSDSGRGMNPTVVLANKSEIRLFESATQIFLDDMNVGTRDGKPIRRLPGAEDTLDRFETYPTWKIRVLNAEADSSSDFIVRRPFAGHSSLLGRATRAYLAYDLHEQRLVFMKDAWRIDHPKLQAEYMTYKYLQDHDIPYVPTIFYGGDVLSSGKPQKTISQAYAMSGESWCRIEKSFEAYTHHRLVQDIAYPLECALNEREFIQGMYDCLRAMAAAFNTAGLLHRDLSLGNVMLDPAGRGTLNDWDHAGRKDSNARGIGTWRFMSLCLLENPTKVHPIADDLESIFWVLLYGALKRFARCNQDRLLQNFDYHTTDPQNGRQVGGQLKESCIFGQRLRKVEFTCDVLQELIDTSKWTWFAYYTILQGTMNLDRTPEVKAKMLKQHNQAKDPAFWVDVFAKALDD